MNIFKHRGFSFYGHCLGYGWLQVANFGNKKAKSPAWVGSEAGVAIGFFKVQPNQLVNMLRARMVRSFREICIAYSKILPIDTNQ